MLRKFSVMFTFLFTFSVLITGCSSDTSSNKDANTELTDVISLYTGFDGSVLVANGDKILLNNGYGMADHEKKIDNKPQTKFGIGSITSQFTATAIMMLQEKKLLNIQDTINKYIPDYPNGDKIKIYNLLTHTSGIPEYFSLVDSIEVGKHTYTPEKLIDLFKDKPLGFDVGTKYEFSNSNYALLGYIIEKVSGLSYEEYIKNNIFKALDMNDSGFYNDINKDNKAIGYSVPETNTTAQAQATATATTAEPTIALNKSIEAEPTLTYAASGIYSTVEDMYKWSKSFSTEKLISKESIKEMFTAHSENYGFGWFIDSNDSNSNNNSSASSSNDASNSTVSTQTGNKDQVVHHGGYLPGYSSFIIRDNTKNYVVIILSNREHAQSVMDMGYELINVLEE